MEYLLLIFEDEKRWESRSPDEQAVTMQKWMAITEELQQSGKLRGGNALQPTATATTVRSQGGKTLVSDGPFVETKEQLGGYYLLEADNLDEAIAWASKLPNMADGGSVEV